MVAAAFVVDGDIYRHEFVAKAVVDGLMRVGLDTGVPVLSVSLTPHQSQETEHHTSIFQAHFVEEGPESPRAVRMLLAMRGRLSGAEDAARRAPAV